MVQNQENQSLILVGMHRSHTSLVASAFHQAGLFLGHQLIAANESNIHGHYESEHIVAFHRRMIDAHGLRNRWQLIDPDKAENAAMSADFLKEAQNLLREHFDRPFYGWKDPRVAFFLKGWHQVLPNPKYIIIVRHPIKVISSLVRRNLSHSNIPFRPFLATRYFNLWDNTYRSVLSFIEEFSPDYHILYVPENLTNEGSVKLLNRRIEEWQFPMKLIDFERVIDPELLSERSGLMYYKMVFNMRLRTKDIYEKLKSLSR